MFLLLPLVCSMKERDGKSHLKPHLILYWPNKWIFTMSNSQEGNPHNVRHSKRTIIASIQYCSNSSVTFVWKFTTVYISHTDYIRICKEVLLNAWYSTFMMEKSYFTYSTTSAFKMLANDNFPCYKNNSIAKWLNYIIYNKLTISPDVVNSADTFKRTHT